MSLLNIFMDKSEKKNNQKLPLEMTLIMGKKTGKGLCCFPMPYSMFPRALPQFRWLSFQQPLMVMSFYHFDDDEF